MQQGDACAGRDVGVLSVQTAQGVPFLRGKGLVKKAIFFFINFFYRNILKLFKTSRKVISTKVFCESYEVGMAQPGHSLYHM